uniref:phosphate acyltransferase n=1 Tax=Aureimonas sp. AU4 TaxID=1638163 RepID=UPI000A5AF584
PRHIRDIRQVIGKAPGVRNLSALSLLISSERTLFFADTYVQESPSAECLAEIAKLASIEIHRFGIKPRAALLSSSNFGTSDMEDAQKLRRALALVQESGIDMEIDGEMHGDAALSEELRRRVMPETSLKGDANLLLFPTLDAANITMNVVKVTTDALHVGPILLGTARPAHILTPSVTSRGVVNMAAIAVAEAVQKDENRASNA